MGTQKDAMAPTRSCLSRQEWVALHMELLEEERKAEVQAAQTQIEGLPARVLEARGVLLGPLVLAERSTGLYGRPVVTFMPKNKDSTLPANSFSAGDIVGVCEGPQQVATAVVVEVGERQVVVAGDEEGREDLDALEDDACLTLRKLASEVTYRRVKAGLEELAREVNTPASHLIQVLFGEAPPRPPAPALPSQLTTPSGDLKLLNEHLDASQQEAVEFALKRSDLAVIHGPPGTGKTTTLVEVIRQHIKLGAKVLVCAPSNLAVDNLVERLTAARVRLVRLGHPARVTPLTQRHTLDAILHNSEEWHVLGDIRAEMEGELGRLRKARWGDQRRHLRTNIKSLRKELKEKEVRLVRQVLLSSEVILATLTSSSSKGPLRHLPPEHLDLVVIDECSQATEASCYLSVLRAPKLVLAGDHCQLPPTIVSAEAATKGLDLSLMERVIGECGEEVVRMLTRQYRMNSTIMTWSSAAMYEGRLSAHSSVASHQLSHLPGVTPTEDTESVAVVVDTAGCECWELDTSDAQSKANPGEAVLVACHVRALVAAGVPEAAVAVITPYNLQVEMVRGLLAPEHPGVEVRSVDGFQGREKEAVVVSLVRSNKQGTVGFLSEDRRLNVAVTRARRHLALIGDSETAGRHPFIRTLFDHLTRHGLVKTAHEFQQELDSTEVRTPECLTWTAKTEKKASGRSSRPGTAKEKDSLNRKTKAKPQPSEEDNQKRRLEYLDIVQSFLNSPSLVYSFPPDLNSFERRLIHQICEELHLNHNSEGDGKERHIVIKKCTIDKHKMEEDEVKKEGEKEEEEEEEVVVSTSQQEERAKVEVMIAEFLESPEENLRLSCKMSAFERSVVHEACEEMGLGHQSEGKGKRRHIVIWKTNKSNRDDIQQQENKNTADSTENIQQHANKKAANDTSSAVVKKADNGPLPSPENMSTVPEDTHNHSNSQGGAVPKARQENCVTAMKKVRMCFIDGRYIEVEEGVSAIETKMCAVCRKEVPLRNYSLHSLQCERRSIGAQQQDDNTAGGSNKENGKKKNGKKGSGRSKKQQENEDDEEDFDSLINKFVKDSNTCSQPHCKTPTSIIFQLCPFCRRTFCLAHHMAEVHGCGPLARQHARTVISREGVLYPGSGIPSKKPSEDKRKQLERKLAKKMDDFSSKRAANKPGKDKENDK